MDYFRKLLDDKYNLLKSKKDNLIDLEVKRRIAETAGIRIGVSPEELKDMIRAVDMTEEDLRVAMCQFDQCHEVEDKIIAALTHQIFSAYEQHKQVEIKEMPDYYGFAKALTDKKDQISCVVHFEDVVFDPRSPPIWEQHDVIPADNVVVYMHNLNGNKYMLEDMIKYIGTGFEEKKIDYISDMLKVEIINGLHMRPAMMVVKAIIGYSPGVFIKKGKEEVDGRSMLQVLTLGAKYGSDVEFKYRQPKTHEDKKKLQELRNEIKKILATPNII